MSTVSAACWPALLAGLVLLSGPCAVGGASAESLWTDPLQVSKTIPDVLSSMPDDGARHGDCAAGRELPELLSLADAVEHALCTSPQTRQAWAAIMFQAAAVGQGRAAYLPTLNAGGSWGNIDKSTSYPGFPQFNSTLHTHSTNANFSMNWVLYDFGLRAANLESARQLLSAAVASRDDSVQTVLLATVQYFYRAQAAQATVLSTREAEEIARKSTEISDGKYRSGVGSLADKLQAQTAYAQSRLERIRAESDFYSRRGALAIAMGYRADRPFRLADLEFQSVDTVLMRETVGQMIDTANVSHPKIKAAQAKVLAARAQLEATEAQDRPVISLFSSDSRSDTPIEQSSSKQIIRSRSIGVQITIPIFDGFSRRYQIHGAQAQVESSQADLEDVQQQVMLEVWNSYQAWLAEFDNLDSTRKLVGIARQSMELATGRYNAGVGTILEMLKAQGDLATAQQQQISTLANWQTAKLRLAASLGQLTLESQFPEVSHHAP